MLLAPILLLCCNKAAQGTSSPPPGTAGATAPPVVDQDAPYHIEILLEGGSIGATQRLRYPGVPPVTRLDLLDDGLRLAVADPAVTVGRMPHRWGFWCFADGSLAEEATLRCRTGTAVIWNGVQYAPPAATSLPAAASHLLLDATLEITRLEPQQGFFEAELRGHVVAPDGKDPANLHATMRLPLPSTEPPPRETP